VEALLGRRDQEYLGTRIAEIGAGIGANVTLLGQAGQEWTCVEPDATLAARIDARVRAGGFAFPCRVATGTCADIETETYDSVLHIDVLEHISDDKQEMDIAAQRLRPGGHLITLSPAHPFLYSPFDAAIGYHRRYTRATVVDLTPPTLKAVRVRYLDSVGLMASLSNRLVLKSAHPKLSEVHLWDRFMVPLSRLVDPITGYRAGKSILCVWRRV
jgi:SAM-dependent methyltransferase